MGRDATLSLSIARTTPTWSDTSEEMASAGFELLNDFVMFCLLKNMCYRDAKRVTNTSQ
jgi:hypothetical protein